MALVVVPFRKMQNQGMPCPGILHGLFLSPIFAFLLQWELAPPGGTVCDPVSREPPPPNASLRLVEGCVYVCQRDMWVNCSPIPLHSTVSPRPYRSSPDFSFQYPASFQSSRQWIRCVCFDSCFLAMAMSAWVMCRLLCIGLLQPLLALCRCREKSRWRPVFNWIHWFLGTVATVLSSESLWQSRCWYKMGHHSTLGEGGAGVLLK